MLKYAGEADETGNGYTASFAAAAIFRTPHDQTPKTEARGPTFSGHADIKGHYQCAKFACLRPLTGDSRG